MQRFFFTISQSLKARRQIKDCLIRSSVCELDLSALQQQAITTLVLDFDGVLNSHGENYVHSELCPWLINCIKLFKVYILSNKPTAERQEYFARTFPQINFITSAKKKPYIDGILQISKLSGSIGQHIMIVDDRLLTGVLAGCLANIKVCFIQAPLVNFNKRPIKELFFLFLRFIERIYLGFKLNDVCGYRKLHKM